MTFTAAEAVSEIVDRERFHNDPLYHRSIRMALDLFDVMDDEMTKAGVPQETRERILRGASTEIVRRETHVSQLYRIMTGLRWRG